MGTVINNISNIVLALTTILLGLTTLRMIRHTQRLEQRLGQRVQDVERKTARLKCLREGQPMGDVYRAPPECERCPESSPAACQACHEEETAYTHLALPFKHKSY